MGINRCKPHLTVFLEDKPYRDIFNGIKRLHYVNCNILDVKHPCGGWVKVFSNFEENLPFINSNNNQYVLLVMDFDNNFQSRKSRFDELIQGQQCSNRVFLFGIEHKESEDLKRFLNITDNEKLGQSLLNSCHDENCEVWKNIHLNVNFSEIERLQQSLIYPIFLSQ